MISSTSSAISPASSSMRTRAAWTLAAGGSIGSVTVTDGRRPMMAMFSLTVDGRAPAPRSSMPRGFDRHLKPRSATPRSRASCPERGHQITAVAICVELLPAPTSPTSRRGTISAPIAVFAGGAASIGKSGWIHWVSVRVQLISGYRSRTTADWRPGFASSRNPAGYNQCPLNGQNEVPACRREATRRDRAGAGFQALADGGGHHRRQ